MKMVLNDVFMLIDVPKLDIRAPEISFSMNIETPRVSVIDVEKTRRIIKLTVRH